MTLRKKPDYYSRLAHKKAYPARSIFKLEEIDKRMGLFARKDRVLDLGSSPGSWLKYILERIGNKGRAVGIDIVTLGIELPSNAGFLLADVMTIDPEEIKKSAGVDTFDVIASDLAPKTTGIKHVDQENSWILLERAVQLSKRLLRRGGHFTGKLFFSPRHKEATQLLNELFGNVRTIQPKATRKESREIFIVGKNFL